MQLIAHRGCADLVPENSLAGVSVTAKLGLTAIECDVSVAADGVAVIFHDEFLTRMTGDARAVWAVPSDHLKALPLIGSDPENIQCIPLACPYFSTVAAEGLFLHLEIKVHHDEVDRVVEAALQALEQSDLHPTQVRVSSFSRAALEAVHRQRPDLSLGWAAEYWCELSLADFSEPLIQSVHLNVAHIHEQDLAEISTKGLAVLLYTVNDLGQLDRLPRSAITGVFTDCPPNLAGGSSFGQ